MTRNVQKTLGLIRVALVACVGFPLMIASSARAQEATPAPPGPGGTEATAERVIVTGSNIPTAEEVGPNPVDTYRRDDITRLGVRTPSDLVRAIPSTAGAYQTESITNGGSGTTQVDLRGIDPKETLVLQDGRRLATAGTQAVDFNQFPVGLIDHLDILKDGASPIYGSEAVDGVINVFLIHRFRGLEVYASYGNTNLGFAGDAGQEIGYLLAGTGDDKTDIVVYAGFYNSAAIFSRDEDLSADANFDPFGGADFRSGNMPARVGGFIYLPNHNGGSLTPTPHSFASAATDPEYTVRTNLPPERQVFNFSGLTPSVAATDREYLYGSFIRDICDKYLTIFADFKYFRQFWDSGFAPTPFAPDFFTDATHPFGITATGFSVPTQNAFNPFTVANYTSPGGFCTKFPRTQASAAPPGTAFTTGVRYRSLEAGLRTGKVYFDNYLFTGGLRGNLGEFAPAWDTLKTWEWQTGIRWNEDKFFTRFGGIVNNDAMRLALLDSNPATAFDPFGVNSNSKAAKDRVFVTTHEITYDDLLTEDFKINGDMFNLPGGPVSFATGVEHRKETFQDEPDDLSISGQTTGSTVGLPTRGGRDAWSIFWETRIPITGPTWNVPGLYSFEVDYAERYENYSDFGETERPKFSIRWQPIDTALTLRAAYIEAFHAPTLGELFSGTFQTFPTVHYINPVTGAFTKEQVQELITGNPALKPEVAYEYTYGGVLTPGKWWSPLQGLTLSADFVHIDLRGFTTVLAAQQIIDTPAFASLLTFDPSTGALVNIGAPFQNLGREILSAWDFEAVETFETSRLGHGDLGTFTATYNYTYLVDADVQFVPNGKRTTVVGKFNGGFNEGSGGGYTHNRFYASLYYDGPTGTWLQGLDTGVVLHYIGQYWDQVGFGNSPKFNDKGVEVDQPTRKIREWYPVDILVNYTFNLPPPAAQTEVAGYAKDGGKTEKMKDGKEKNVMPVSTAEYNPCGWRAWLNNLTLTLGVNNVGDELPPFAAGATGADFGFDRVTANDKGRFWYASIKKRF